MGVKPLGLSTAAARQIQLASIDKCEKSRDIRARRVLRWTSAKGIHHLFSFFCPVICHEHRVRQICLTVHLKCGFRVREVSAAVTAKRPGQHILATNCHWLVCSSNRIYFGTYQLHALGNESQQTNFDLRVRVVTGRTIVIRTVCFGYP